MRVSVCVYMCVCMRAWVGASVCVLFAHASGGFEKGATERGARAAAYLRALALEDRVVGGVCCKAFSKERGACVRACMLQVASGCWDRRTIRVDV